MNFINIKNMNNEKINIILGRYVNLIIINVLLSIPIFSQTDSEFEYNFDLSLISEVHSGNSYVTAGGGFGNIESLIFEANLIPNFILRTNKDAKLMGVLTPQIILRMYNEESLPVQTPSYMPQITLYYSIGKELSINNFTMFGKIAHHSNGQQDNFYLENGEINYKSGNFSTNYFEVGVIKTFFDRTLNAAQFFSTSFQVHPEPLSIKELKGIYSLYRWNTEFAIFKLPFEKRNNKKEKANFSLKGYFTWLFGDVNNWKFFSFDRIIASVTFYYHPSFLEDIGLFVQYYHGQDYYNIYFPKTRDIIRIGFMTEQFRF
ncbi:MAG: hypothetical protein L3J41_05570 [Melioribacteraceae bacterium]|nr:hypothetical protein [Melioribacteraceae bacterium]